LTAVLAVDLLDRRSFVFVCDRVHSGILHHCA
jgi:hypothetical protein